MQTSFIDQIEEYLASGKASLPVFSSTAMQIQQELVKKEPDVKRVEQLINYDQSLTSEVLRLANSPCYRGLAEVKTIKAAVVRLGLQEVCRITLLASSKGQFSIKDKGLRPLLKKLWQHAAGCALAAHWLTKRCNYDDLVGQAFFAGLLHDIGKLAILIVIEQLKINQSAKMTDALLIEVLNTLHTKLGYTLMKSWNMPAQYCKIARDHHLSDVDQKDSLLQIVRVADMTCHKLSIGVTAVGEMDVASLPEVKLLGLSELALAELEIMLEDTRMLWQ